MAAALTTLGFALLGDPMTFMVALVGAIAALFLRSWRSRTALVILAVTFERFTAEVAGISLRVDQVVAVLVFAVCASGAFVTRQRWMPLPGFRWLGVFLVVGVASGFASQGDRPRTLAIAGMVCAGVMLAMAVVQIVRTNERLRWATNLLIGVAALHGAAGALLFAAAHLKGSTVGIQIDSTNGQYVVYGTFFEGNIYGSFMAAALLVALGATYSTRASRLAARTGTLLIASGLAVSFTRAAWLAWAIGLVVLLLKNSSRSRHRMHAAAFASGIGVIVAFLLVRPATESLGFSTRLRAIVDLGSPTFLGRLNVLQVALEEWWRNPWFGSGFGSFHTVLPDTDIAWIPNLAVSALHDTGMVGLALLVVFFAGLLVPLIRTTDSPHAPAYIAALVAILFTSQATSGFILGYFWLFVGLAAAALNVERQVGGDPGPGRSLPGEPPVDAGRSSSGNARGTGGLPGAREAEG